ncbi:MAG: hypothetical protein E7638_05830 [Ruminococcaceae bacterium]|nr:hypothetical protein [Oscillospiraceae bacterium]
MAARRDIASVLAEHDIPEEEFVRWLEDGAVAEYLYRMGKYTAMARCPEVWAQLKQLADDGDVRAIKLYIELCGREALAENGAKNTVPTVDPVIEAARREVFGDE